MTAHKGNILLPLISAIAVLALVAAGYFFWKSQQNTGQPLGPYTPPAAVNNPNSPTTRDETANWKTYNNLDHKFSFQYPPSWHFDEEKTIEGGTQVLVDSRPILKDAIYGKRLSLDGIDIYISVDSFNQATLSENEFPQTRTKISTEFSGEKAYKTTTIAEEVGEGPKGASATWLEFNHQGRGWTIWYPNTDFKGSHNPVFDQILSTFKFISTENPYQTLQEARVKSQSKDVSPPIIYILEPQDKSKIKSGIVKIVANVTDDTKVDRVQFFIGPENTPAYTLSSPPYEYSWDTSRDINAMNIPIQVRAYDTSGNMSYQFISVDPER